MPAMAPPGDGSVIRRSIYQNSNTLVEVLIKSKEPRLRGAGGPRSTAASEPAWPAAVPVRKDGRPLTGSAQRAPGRQLGGTQQLPGWPLSAAAQLPSRPRNGRQLPTWRHAADGEARNPSTEQAAGRGGRQLAGRGGGPRAAPARPPPARQPPPPEGVVPGRPPPGRAGREVEGEVEEHVTPDEFKTWTVQLNKLVQEIKKRPATAHLRPLLARLEETVRVPPVPLACPEYSEDDPLRQRLEEIQEENEELQRKFQTLSATMREYQQQLGGGGDLAVRPGPEHHGRRTEAEAELAEVKHQLAKYKKYAKELKKTKENLLSTIQALEETHATELKELKEEHETQLAQVLAQVTSETEMICSFRADAEVVQRSLALRARENADLQRAVAERDAEIERLAALNQALHDLALKQLRQSEMPSLRQLMTKLQSPPSAGGPAPDGAGDGAPRPAWGGPDATLLSLDVTAPLPARPFPRPDWADVSLGSVTSSAAVLAAQRVPGDGGRDRRPPSGGAGDQRPVSGGGGDQRLASDGGGNQQQGGGDGGVQRPSSDGGTNWRLFGGEGDQWSVSGRAGDQRPSSGARGDQRPSSEARGDQIPSSEGRGDQIPSSEGRGDQRPSSEGRGDQIPSSGARGDQRPSSGARGDQRPSSGARGDQRPPTGGADQCRPFSGGGGHQRPPPVGSQTSEEGFQRSLARLNERLSDLQQGVSRAAQELSP